ncbi:MAG: hypothetical protein ABSC55_02295 [Syntrophorhabdales bacterium]|jgi:hypothetical protein
MMSINMQWVEKNGTAARGKREYLAFLRGEHLTLKQRVLANCYECTGMYTDGREDCDQMETCVFHVYMPYRKNGAMKERTLSGETKAKLKEAQLQRRENIKSIVVA